MKTNQDLHPTTRPAFGSLVAECKKRDIGRTTAFKLARDGVLSTFCIGRRRYVVIASLDNLACLDDKGV